ncbi:EamA family transporter [Vibrio kyushuensis]|uniref:DMT family transporter n=1 Tax=Vibrio kyushuensis TaxID=2910249 RepID=UPI003D0978BC
MLKANKILRGIGAVTFSSVLWGTTGTTASLTSGVSPLAIGAFSTGLGGLLLLIYSYKAIKRDMPMLLSNPLLLLIGSLSVALYPLAFYTSMNWSGIAIGTVVSIASAPFFTAILERLISKKSIKVSWVVSFAFGGLGITFLAFSHPHQYSPDTEFTRHNLGLVLGLIAGLTYAFYSWAAKELIDKGISSKSSMGCLFGLACLLLLPSLLYTGDNLFRDAEHTMIALYLATIPMFIGYLCFGYGLRYIEASKATLITLLEPLVATVLAVVIVGEQLTKLGWVGISSIILCLLIQIKSASPIPKLNSNKASARNASITVGSSSAEL